MTTDVHFELCRSIETLYKFGRPGDALGDITDVDLYQQIRAKFDGDGLLLFVTIPWVITKTIGGERESVATIMNDGRLYLMPNNMVHFSAHSGVKML